MFEDFLDGFEADGLDDVLVDGDDVQIDINAIDLDGDGVEDVLALDLDGDGVLDSIADMEGTEMITMMDQDNDGIEETSVYTQFLDDDGDGVADRYLETLVVDDDNDGFADAVVSVEGFDLDMNGTLDYVRVSEDFNGDGEINLISDYTITEDGEIAEVGSWDTSALSEVSNYTQYDGSDDGIVGNPVTAMEFWHPQEGNQCAVCSQEFVLESLIGRDVDGNELREVAEANGWFDPAGGTVPNDVGNILEYYGFNVERSDGNTYEDLRSALADGNGVIVGVDSDEIWSGKDDDFFGPGMDPDHAIQVIGIDESDPNNIMVIVNDSGVANGQGAMIPLEDFMNAWEDSGCFMMEAFADSAN